MSAHTRRRPTGRPATTANACTQTDTCQAGACSGGNPVTCTASDQCHDVGTCNPATGACSNPAKANGTSCSDGNACTQTDTCQSGACAGANPVICTAPGPVPRRRHLQPGDGRLLEPGQGRTARRAATATPARRPTPARPAPAPAANPVTCTAPDQCHDVGTCNSSTGACSNPAKAERRPRAATATPARRPTPASPAPAPARNPVTCTASGPVPRRRHLQPAHRRLLEPGQAERHDVQRRQQLHRHRHLPVGKLHGGREHVRADRGHAEMASDNHPAPMLDGDVASGPDHRWHPGTPSRFTSTVTNTGTMLDDVEFIDVQNTSASTFVVAGYRQTLEYQDGAERRLDAVRAASPTTPAGNLIPETTLFQTPVRPPRPPRWQRRNLSPPGEPRHGDVDPAGRQRPLGLGIAPTLPADIVAIIFDPAQSSGVRAVVSFDVPSGTAAVGQHARSPPGLPPATSTTSPSSCISRTSSPAARRQAARSDVGRQRAAGARAIARLHGDVHRAGDGAVPGVRRRDRGRVRGRLVQRGAADTSPTVVVTGQATPVNPAAGQATHHAAAASRCRASLSTQKTGPAAINAGLTAPYSLTLPNSGNARGEPFTLTDSVDGQPVTIGNLSLPATVAAGATRRGHRSRPRAARAPGGPDDRRRRADLAGPQRQRLRPDHGQLHGHHQRRPPEGYLSLTARRPTSPTSIGVDKPLTVTALDPYGNPAPGVERPLRRHGRQPADRRRRHRRRRQGDVHVHGHDDGRRHGRRVRDHHDDVITLDPDPRPVGRRRSERRARGGRRRST